MKNAGLGLMLMLLLIGAWFSGYMQGSAKGQRKLNEADRVATEKLLELTLKNNLKTQQLRQEIEEHRLQAQKEKNNADNTINALRSDIRNGHLRLSIISGSGNRGPLIDYPDFGDGETRTELDTQTAESLVAITAEGDDAIRSLNSCIDQYESVRRHLQAQADNHVKE